jgi:Transposase
MSKRGPRFSEREKLATLKEGEKNSVKAVCAKYGISDQSYRLWRYKVKGIQPRKPFSIKKKREILEEGYQKGIKGVCAAYRIDPRTYYLFSGSHGVRKNERRNSFGNPPCPHGLHTP